MYLESEKKYLQINKIYRMTIVEMLFLIFFFFKHETSVSKIVNLNLKAGKLQLVSLAYVKMKLSPIVSDFCGRAN